MALNVFCKNCRSPHRGAYCPNCGQKNILPEDRVLTRVFREYFQDLSTLNGKFLKSLRTLFSKPGQISLDIIHGITVRHYSLSALFLLSTLFYFLLPNEHSIRNNMVNTYQQEVYGEGVSLWKKSMAEKKCKRNS